MAYFISSLTDPKEVFALIRDHWAVENNLHYCLDVILGEDQSLKRKDNEAKNWNIINKIALFFLEKQKEKTKIPIKNLRKRNATMKPSQILEYNYL
ncbi:transposase [Porphyromonas levii]|nr:transposase [Porphyromonas levii]